MNKCKLCGNSDIRITKEGWREAFSYCENWIIYCSNCGCKIELPASAYWDRISYSKKQAIERWNDLNE